MKIQKYIEKIVNDGDRKEMEELSEILEEVIGIIKKYDEDCYKEYSTKLYKMAYGNELTEDIAMEIVDCMQPYGMNWSIDETERMQRDRGLNDIRPVDFFIVMNSAYNDFKNVLGDNTEMYIRYTDAFINDEDARKDKVFQYFMIIPK